MKRLPRAHKLLTLDDLVGRTIKEVRKGNEDEFAIVFEDGDALYVACVHVWDSADLTIITDRFQTSPILGFVTEDQIKNRERALKRQRTIKEKAEAKRKRRQEYEALKMEFEVLDDDS